MSAYLGSIKVWDSSTPPAPTGWVRPADWLAMPTVLATEQKIVGLHAVWPTDGNFCALTCAGAYTVDWGDGNTEDVASGVTAYHEYSYSTAALVGTESTRGYRQALVTITPQSGQSLTSVDFNVKHNQSGLVSGYASGWLDIAFSAPNCTVLTMSASTLNVRHMLLEQFIGVSCGLPTNMSYMFSSCYSLTSLDLSSFNTAAVTTTAGMFNVCASLTSLDLSSFNTAAVTDMSYMFSGCYSLTSLDLSSFNTVAVTNMSFIFSSCYSLTSLDLSSFNTAAVTDMSYMFSVCASLALLDLSSFNTVAVTSMSGMFYSCYSLASLDLSSFNTVAVTTTAGMFHNCYSLTSLAFPSRITFSVASCKLSATALNALYTSLPTVVGQTLTVTGNYGVSGDDPEIARTKGWTVTG